MKGAISFVAVINLWLRMTVGLIVKGLFVVDTTAQELDSDLYPQQFTILPTFSLLIE